MSNSKKKMSVKATTNTPWDKRWAVVEFTETGQRWIPSFEDLHRIVQAISLCEDEKYPPQKGYKGRRFVEEFLRDAVNESDFSVLAQKYKIPQRCGSLIINKNGANIND